MKLTIKKKFNIEIPEANVYFYKHDFSGYENKVFYAVIPDFSSVSPKGKKIVNFFDVTIVSKESIISFTILVHSLVNMLLDVEKQTQAAFLTDFFIIGIDNDAFCKRSDVEHAFLLTIQKMRQNMSEEDRSFENEFKT